MHQEHRILLPNTDNFPRNLLHRQTSSSHLPKPQTLQHNRRALLKSNLLELLREIRLGILPQHVHIQLYELQKTFRSNQLLKHALDIEH